MSNQSPIPRHDAAAVAEQTIKDEISEAVPRSTFTNGVAWDPEVYDLNTACPDCGDPLRIGSRNRRCTPCAASKYLD